MASKLDHVYLCVKNLDRAIKFYEELLGLKVTNKYENRWADFQNGEGIYLGLYNPSFDNQEYKLGNSTVVALKTDDIEKEHQRLKKIVGDKISEIEYVNFITPYKYFIIEDPEGNTIEITQYE